jgi:hypothetical protein
MACYINIENRYRCASLRERQMHHVWAATAAAVVTVGGAAVSAGMQASAADKAAKSQGRASKKLKKQLEQIKPPKYDLAQDIKEAGKITDYNLSQLEQIFPGAKGQRQVAARATDAMLRGEIPQDVQQQIMRSVAELGGAGFAPQQAGRVGGFQAAQGLLSRQLGLTSLDLQQMGQQSSQAWQKLAGAFIESPLQVGQARLQFEKAAADTQAGIAGSQYGASTQAIGSRFAADSAVAQGISDVTGTIGQLGRAGYGAYGQYATAAGGGAGAVTGFQGKRYVPITTSSGNQAYSLYG